MLKRITMSAHTWTIFLLLLGLSWGQNKNYFEWKPVKTTGHVSLSSLYADSTTPSYGARYYDDMMSAPYGGTTGYYGGDTSMPYLNGPYSDDSYSADFPKSYHPYPYPGDSGSYEQSYPYAKDENFNITKEKYGGFGGTGDTRGFGAYDYPKKVQDVPQHLHEDTKYETDFPDLLRIGRSRIFHRRHPMPVHPLPPPL